VSFMVVTPESVTTAVENLACIGSTLQAAAAATGPTTGLAAAAADEVSAAISQLFASYGHNARRVKESRLPRQCRARTAPRPR
jgi:hypothetical protein